MLCLRVGLSRKWLKQLQRFGTLLQKAGKKRLISRRYPRGSKRGRRSYDVLRHQFVVQLSTLEWLLLCVADQWGFVRWLLAERLLVHCTLRFDVGMQTLHASLQNLRRTMTAMTEVEPIDYRSWDCEDSLKGVLLNVGQYHLQTLS